MTPAELDSLKQDKHGFRLRGADMTRIETFTDAAFAFALTLLVISNDPLSTMADIMKMVQLVPVFLMSASRSVPRSISASTRGMTASIRCSPFMVWGLSLWHSPSYCCTFMPGRSAIS